MNTYDIERAVLSSVIQADALDTEQNVGIDPADFADGFHRSVAAVVEALRRKGAPVTQESVAFVLEKNRLMDDARYMHILSATPYASTSTVNGLMRMASAEKKTAAWETV